MNSNPLTHADIGELTIEDHSSKLGDRVQIQIAEWLRATGYKIGAKLPGERELARRFGVSRPVLREALRALQQQGLIAIQPGRGNFVRGNGLVAAMEAVATSLSSYDITMQELAESRSLIEPYIASVAAQRRTDADLDLMEQALARMEFAGANKKAFMAAVWDFHIAVAKATHNHVFALWMQPMMKYIFESRKEVVGLKEVRERAFICHKEILDAVRKQDAERASKAATTHIGYFVKHTKLAIKMGLLPPDSSEPRGSK